MRSESYGNVAFDFSKIENPLPSPTGRTDGVFTVVLPSVPSVPTANDEVLIGFEFGNVDHDVDGRDFLLWRRAPPTDVGVEIEKITIVHEGFELV